jgi:hypothetical protein
MDFKSANAAFASLPLLEDQKLSIESKSEVLASEQELWR